MNRPDTCPIKREDCTQCGFRRGKDCNCPSRGAVITPEEIARRKLWAKERDKKELEYHQRIVGQSVVSVEPYGDGCFLILFDNGLKLTASDGEYGNNAFRFID